MKKILKTFEANKMKESDPLYGTYDSKTRQGKDGQKNLYAHDFILWLDAHANEL